MVGGRNFDPSKNRKIKEIADSSLKGNTEGWRQMKSDLIFVKIQSCLIDSSFSFSQYEIDYI